MADSRRAFAFAFFACIGVLGVWLATKAFRADPLPLGAPLPDVTVHDGARALPLSSLARGPAVVVWFHIDCLHCQRELQVLERGLSQLRIGRVILLTGQDSVPRHAIAAAWPALARSERISWGTVEPGEFSAAFGTSLVPAAFTFDERGRLVHKVVGESKLDRVLAVLASSGTR